MSLLELYVSDGIYHKCLNSTIYPLTSTVVAMSSSQCVNRGRACIVVNRDNYSEYYMCVQWPSTFFAKSLFFAHFKVLLIIALLNNYAHLMYLCNKCCLGTYYL